MFKITKQITIFSFIGVLAGVLFITTGYFLESGELITKTSNDLVEITEEKAQEINFYLDKIRKDAQTLQESSEVKELLKRDLVFDEDVIKRDVDQRSKIISKGIENYLEEYPEMTLKELQESPEFRKIAIQPVSKEGYSGLYDRDSQIIVLHKFLEFVGVDLLGIEKELPEIFHLQLESVNNSDVSGFYDWKDPSGEVRRKYSRLLHIDQKTADGIKLVLATTAYVDDYRIIGKNSEYLESFVEEYGYHNLILLSPSGYVSYMPGFMDDSGTCLEWEVNLDSGLSKNYYEAKETKDYSFYGPFMRHHGDVYSKFSAMAPVYDENDLLGYVGLIGDMDDIFEIVDKHKGLGKTEESYLINQNRVLISPLEYKNFDMFVQTIDTESSLRCFSKPGSIEHVGHESVDILLNYEGESTISAHTVILEPLWCLITEIEESEVSLNFFDYISKKEIFVFLILVLLGFLLGKYLPIHHKYFENKRLLWAVDRLANIKLKYSFLLAMILVIGYISLFNFLFEDFKIINEIPDLAAFVVSFIMVIYSFKIRNLKLGIGGSLICLSKLIETYLELNTGDITFFAFVLVMIIIFGSSFGLIFLLFGFKKIIK